MLEKSKFASLSCGAENRGKNVGSSIEGGISAILIELHEMCQFPGKVSLVLAFGSHLFLPCSPPQTIPWKWLFGATAVALGGVALSVVIAARN